MPPEHTSRDEALVELADRIVHIARKLNARTHQDPQIVPLSPLEALILRHVDQNPRITSSRIAADLELRTSNASTALRALVEKSLLRRESHPEDRRAVRFTLTSTAVDSVERLRAQWTTTLEAALPDTMDPVDALAVLRALEDGLG